MQFSRSSSIYLTWLSQKLYKLRPQVSYLHVSVQPVRSVPKEENNTTNNNTSNNTEQQCNTVYNNTTNNNGKYNGDNWDIMTLRYNIAERLSNIV